LYTYIYSEGVYKSSEFEAGVRVEPLKPIGLTKSEGWFKLGKSYVVIKFSKGKAVKVIVISDGVIVGNYALQGGLNCSNTQIVVEGVNICEELFEVINQYSELVEQYELVERAKAAQVLGDELVPSMPKEYDFLVYLLTKKLLESRVVKTFYFHEGVREVVLGTYCYENGYYRECSELLKNELMKIVNESGLLDVKAAPYVSGVVVKNVGMRTLTEYRPSKRMLLFNDKVFSWGAFIETKDLERSLIEPSPDLIVMHRIQWSIRPELYKHIRPGLMKYMPPKSREDIIELFKELAPKSFKAFMDWVKKPGEDEKDAYPRVALLLEIIGYTLYSHEYPFHKIVLLVGDGSNGKSTYVRLIETILGKQNVTSINMAYLDPRINRFAASSLHNKLANLSTEPIKERSFDPTLLKMLTGEDLVWVEDKFKPGFPTHNYAKMVFAANELPEVTEDTYAFWSRWIVIQFPNRFPQDPEFFERTFTSEEIEGIIICALHAFRLVLERKEFTEIGVVEVREEWLSRSNPVYRVVKRMIDEGVVELDLKGVVVKSDLYQLYKKYVEILSEEGYEVTVLEQKDFTRSLTRYFPIKTGDSRILGRKKRVYVGVKIKNYDKALELVGSLETPRTLT